MPTRRAAAFCLLGLALGLAAWGSRLSLLPGAPGYIDGSLTVEDGLPRAGITRIVEARDGFLWLATFDGIARFDGVRFEIFDSGRLPVMGSDRIVDLFEGRDGTLWFRSEQGHVMRYAAPTFHGCGLLPGGGASCNLDRAGSPSFSAAYEDRSGAVWLAGSAGLFRFTSGQLERVPGFADGSEVTSLLRDSDGALWVGTRSGLWTGRPGRFRRVQMPPGGIGIGVGSLAESDRREIWATTSVATGRIRAGRFEPEISGGFAAGDATGALWLARTGSLVRQRGGRVDPWDAGLPGSPVLLARQVAASPGETWIGWSRTLFRNGVPVLRLPAGHVVAVERGADGTTWLALSDSGRLHAVRPARVTAITSGLASAVLYPVFEDRDGALLVGGLDTVARLAPGSERFQSREGPAGPLDNVVAFLRDRSGALLIGTNRGLFSEEKGRYVGPLGPRSMWEAGIHALYEDHRGTLWIGTDRGLFRREAEPQGGRWSEVTAASGLLHPFVRVIRESPAGTLWFGTNGGGVIRLSAGGFRAVTRAQGLSSDLVRALYPAPDGRLWIATENAGINRLDPASLDRPDGRPEIAVIAESQGLYARGVHQLVADDFGNIWMSSNRGLFRARLADLNAAADGRMTRLATVAYDERDGMANSEANGGGQDSGLRDRQGRIWFPTQEGLVRIDPRQALAPEPPSPVHVVRLRNGDEEVPLDDARLSPGRRSFTVEFTAPSFRAPRRQRFRYRLVPYDRGWIDPGSRREATYTQVPPGRYTFEVQVASPEGEWNERAATVQIEAVPRFFETAWFLTACGLAAAALLAGVLRLRGARLRARQHELERMVDERTTTIAEQAERLRELDRLRSQFFANVSHEFRTPLTLVLGPLEDALSGRLGKVSGEFLRELDIARRNAKRLLGLVDQLLDVARLDTGRMDLKVQRADLALHLSRRVEAFLPLAERRGTVLELVIPDGPVELYFDEVQLEKVFDNLIGNALKFTPEGGHVHVALTVLGEEAVEVIVQDDGPGIPAELLPRVFERFYQVDATARRRFSGTGIGLALAKQIVELHGGSISAASGEARGTRFTVALRCGGGHFPPEVMAGRIPTGAVVDEEMPSFLALAQASLWAETDPPPDDTGELPQEDDRTTVLVVDDHPEIRAYVRRHLTPSYRVLEASDGLEGLELARRFIPDLVVSDVMMPGLDGNSLFRTLREDPELEFVPFVLLTAKASAESRILGLQEGVDDYLVKPFDPRELKARIDNLIALRKRLFERFESTSRPLKVSEVDITPADEIFLARVQALVEERLGDPELSVEALAKALHCDRSYLLRKLRALTGETPSDLIRSLRLQRAEQLLRASAGAISEIAYAVGFKSVAHFSNAFQARFNERPSAFAARHRS